MSTSTIAQTGAPPPRAAAPSRDPMPARLLTRPRGYLMARATAAGRQMVVARVASSGTRLHHHHHQPPCRNISRRPRGLLLSGRDSARASAAAPSSQAASSAEVGHHEHAAPTLRSLLGGATATARGDDGGGAAEAAAPSSSPHPDRVVELTGDALDAHLERILDEFRRTGGGGGGGSYSSSSTNNSAATATAPTPTPTPPRRVMLKVSGEALAGAAGHGVDAGVLDAVAREIRAAVLGGGVQVCVVVGGGNYWRGAEAAGVAGIDRPTADHVGMLATVMNALCLQAALESLGVPARVQSAIEMREVAEPYVRRRAVRHLERGRVVLFAAGTGSPFFSTDTAAALRAAEVGAGVVLKATKVDGVYDRDPRAHPREARRYERLSYAEVAQGELGVMDAAAIALCRENGIPVVVFNAFGAGNVLRAALGVEGVGTTVGGGSGGCCGGGAAGGGAV